MVEHEVVIRVRVSRRILVWGAAALLLCCAANEAVTESMTMTTYFPAPSGTYLRLVTTGGTAAQPRHTILSRDTGNVGIGTTNPRAPAPNNLSGNLDVNDVYIRGAGKWASQIPTPVQWVQMYRCPGPVSLGGGAWGYYGCQNQITNTPTCYEIEYPNSQTFPCAPIGRMALY